MNGKQPRKHAELIKAWADGAEIQVRLTSSGEWVNCLTPEWVISNEYRIKPEPKPDHIYYGSFGMPGRMRIDSCFMQVYDRGDKLKLTFDGETGELKSAEVLLT